jgi:hypothetical protein
MFVRRPAAAGDEEAGIAMTNEAIIDDVDGRRPT